MKNYRKLAIIGISVIIVGLIGLTPFALSLVHAKQPTKTVVQAPIVNLETPRTAVDATISGKPVRLEVPAAKLNIAIIDGIYDTNTGEWSLSDTKAQFALPTTLPNNKAGNSLIYGHDTNAVFHSLHTLKPGAEAKIFTENGHVLTYHLRSSEVVDPSNTAILNYDGKPQLTLQTCTGLWSENRKFFYFDLVDAQ